MNQTTTNPMESHARTPATFAPTAGRQYEFGPGQNVVIGGLASTMSLFGVALMIFGILQVAVSMDFHRADMPAPLVPGILGLMFGGLILYAADAFRKIVRTQGHDIDHLMDALSRLKFVFALQLGVAALAIAAAIVVVAVNR